MRWSGAKSGALAARGLSGFSTRPRQFVRSRRETTRRLLPIRHRGAKAPNPNNWNNCRRLARTVLVSACGKRADRLINAVAPDIFNVRANGVTVFSYAFAIASGTSKLPRVYDGADPA